MDLARLFTPRDPDLRQIAARIHAERPDLRATFPQPDGTAFWQWLGSYGLLEHPEVARHYPPLPSDSLRSTVCGGMQYDTHLRTGAEDCRLLLDLYELFAQRSADEIGDVFDFGCGCGRALRWFASALPSARLAGADVRVAAIDWCRANLRGDFRSTATTPPLPFADGAFDLTYALSVFSHLTREQCIEWMRELARVTRPDGLILISTHGAFAAAVTSRSPDHQHLLKIDAEDARGIVRALATEDFVHRVSSPSLRQCLDGVADDYGNAFFGEVFARTAFADFAEYLGGVPCALNLWQDVHAYRPRRR